MTPESHSLLVANPALENRTARDLLDELKKKLDAAEARGELIDGNLFIAYMDAIKQLDPTNFEPVDPLETLRQVEQKHPELFPQTKEQTNKTQRRFFHAHRLSMLAIVAIGLSLILAVNLLLWAL